MLHKEGLRSLRSRPIPALVEAATLCGLTDPTAAVYTPAAVAELLNQAVAGLGEGELGTAAKFTLGLVPGTAAWPVADRRRRAAEAYHVQPETFRKEPEQRVIEQVAEEIIKLCRQAALAARGGTAGAVERPALPGPGSHPIVVRTEAGPRTLWLDAMPVELLHGVDVIVSSENVYFEMAKSYGASLSAALRRGGARTDSTGAVLEDVISDELTGWVRKHGRVGRPVAPGTVAPTGAGDLVGQGIRLVLHAAVVVPRSDGTGYDVPPETINAAVHAAFALAREQRRRFDPELSSIGLPLFGAGHGGIDPHLSFRWVWSALRSELAAGDFAVHVITKDRDHAEAVLGGLAEADALDHPGVV